ncbi:MAG: TonB-dependent receptor [Verrucomicrobia bacterium]|nr:TonB-dependent receptor [Verrucomicrobiota bacterium]
MIKPTPFLRSAWTAALVLVSAVCALAADAPKKSFQIPAGDAVVTLKRFSEQSGEQIVYPVDAVRGIQTKAVSGDLTARDALDRLLSGTELRVVQDAKTGALAIQRVAPAPGGTGMIDGQVFNPASGTYVNNARVTIDALGLETFTDEYGQYRFPRVAAGDVAVRVFFTGLPPETQIVKVAAGESAKQDFTLRTAQDAAKESDKVVTLDAFTVAAGRDMVASDVAVNEQRYSPSIKNVVSTDSFGDIAEGNVGEFAKFMPGVTLNRNGSDGFSISIGGVPSGATPIMVDGNPLSSAASSGGSRTVELEQVSITTMSRVEVTRSQTPDAPANSIGGTMNLVTRSAFERRQPEYSLKSYVSFRGGDFSLSKQADTFGKETYPFEPNLEVSAIVPITRDFGITASGLVSRAPANGQGSLMTWAPTTNPNVFNLTAFRLQERPKLTVRDSLSLGADWRVTPRDVLTVGFQYAYFTTKFWVRQLNFATGTVASSGEDFTQGANGTGSVQILYDAREKAGTTYVPSFRFKHNGPVWQWQVNGAYSHSTNFYRNLDKGYFNRNNAYLRNVTVRFEKMNFDHPDVVTVRNATNTAPVDPYELDNYKLETVSANRIDGYDTVRSVSAFVKRDLSLRVPLTVKLGADLKSQHRDIGNTTFDASYVGAGNAGQWLDPVYSRRNLLFGDQKMEWMNLHKIVDTYKATPSAFSQTETNLVNGYRSTVTNSKVIDEVTTAPYLRLDTKFLDGRLQLTGGVRYERTDDTGAGPLIDLTKTYQRDAAGNIVRNAAGAPVIAAPVATLAGTRLAYIERGARIDRSYGGYYPSLSANFNLRPDLIARASYGKSISRPEFSDVFPSASLPDPAGTSRTITLSNPALKPWIADSYGLALEYYFNQPSSGVLSTRVYRRDIQDFWGTDLVPATADVLEPYGLDPAVYGDAQGSMRVTGAEFDYRQNLSFLPHWARGFTLFGNITMQHLQGAQGASFSGLFVAKTTNFGLTFSRARLTMRIAVNQKGTVRQGQITGTNREPGTFQYILPRNSADFSAEYRLTRKLAIFVGGRNINEATDDTVVYGPTTRSDRILSARADYRAYWNIGLKGTF